ncbi:XrtA/PEP-CTERM system histidine kinase PrsK [Oleiagrimonas sp. C23AA]|uniref:XrtA/PEP-CTERM system histidine kinase PrsK n=1 Tax=Oleiagrimonas sp. C23AA TaxID=2719047 RepID=UPI0014233C8F|nr:XrtA/PEP-CTERM system histidine kinase PrsK [Oleiagrimonas sp. C23AA]NII10575.1 PEP-CTERM system histidine kinase PrsK [Oleiagrimonas sp. C23AA]
MHIIIIASYLTAAAAYLVGTVLLAAAWRGQRTGAQLVLATSVTTLWAGFLAWVETRHALAGNWLLLAETLRYGAWIGFLSALFGAWPTSGTLRGIRIFAHALWIVIALYCLWPATGLPDTTWSTNVNVPIIGMLILALTGVILLEQLYRNVAPEQRWALKFLLIALGVLFAYDIFLYSYAALYRQFNVSAWAARGFIDALLVPLLLIAAARNPSWSLNVGVSRRVVFYSSSLLVVAFYIMATAIGGYYVRLYGGDWGRVAQITLVCFALLSILLIASSGRARSRLRVFVHKHFFSFRHDYREQWLRLTATLSARDIELSMRAVQGMAQIMDSPAGALFTSGTTDEFVLDTHWNMPASIGVKLPVGSPALQFMRERRWIYDLDQPPPLNDERWRIPTELAGLPHAWLVIPLVLEDRLVGFVVLAQARARRAIDWEDIDLLRAAGTQVAGTLAQAADARHLAEARQFEGFNRLTAFLMHDLKNIAAQQSLLLQNAERHKRNPAFVDDMLITVENSVHRISRLLQQLRGEAATAAQTRVDIASVVEKAISECRAYSPMPVYQPMTAECWVRADGNQLATVLGHLIRNAQEATTMHGHVAVRVERDSRHATIIVEDNGTGMDEDFIRHRLFQPFFTTKASKGMGIGAYQAREYVQSLGGALRVHSTPGQGTELFIQLPLAGSEEQATTAGKRRATS